MNINHNAAKGQKEGKLLPKGDYTFKVLSAEEKKSQKGQDMFALRLAVYTEEGRKVAVKDWAGEWNWSKVQGLAESLGLADDYASGQLQAIDMVSLTGTAHIRPGKDHKGEPANTVAWYVPRRDGSVPEDPARQDTPTVPVEDDDIPF